MFYPPSWNDLISGCSALRDCLRAMRLTFWLKKEICAANNFTVPETLPTKSPGGQVLSRCICNLQRDASNSHVCVRCDLCVCVFQDFFRQTHTCVTRASAGPLYGLSLLDCVIGAAEMDVSSFFGVASSDSFGITQDHVYSISTCALSHFTLIWQTLIWFQRCLMTGDVGQLNKNVMKSKVQQL